MSNPIHNRQISIAETITLPEPPADTPRITQGSVPAAVIHNATTPRRVVGNTIGVVIVTSSMFK